MKLLAAAALALFAVLPAQAQDAGPERARLKALREAADARFAGDEKACRATFAVNDCVDRARRARNATVADLRRQELTLNEAERRRRAAERQREMDERHSPERARAAAQQRDQARVEHDRRQAEAAERARRRTEEAAGRAARVREPRQAEPMVPQGTPRGPRVARTLEANPQAAAARRRAQEARVREAREHKQEVLERLERRGKPAAASLPTPP